MGAITLGAGLAFGMTALVIGLSENAHRHHHVERVHIDRHEVVEHADEVGHADEVVISSRVDGDAKTVRVRVGERLTVEADEAEAPAPQPLVYIDGVRVEADRETVLSELDPDTIDRIEVVKGDAAVRLFGDEATGGVIQIFLKDVGSAHPGG